MAVISERVSASVFEGEVVDVEISTWGDILPMPRSTMDVMVPVVGTRAVSGPLSDCVVGFDEFWRKVTGGTMVSLLHDNFVQYINSNEFSKGKKLDPGCQNVQKMGIVDKNHLRGCAVEEVCNDAAFEYAVLCNKNLLEARFNICVDAMSTNLLSSVKSMGYHISQNYNFVILTNDATRKRSCSNNYGDCIMVKSPRVKGTGRWVNGFCKEFREAIASNGKVRCTVIQKLVIEVMLGLPHTSLKGETLYFNIDTHEIVYSSKPCTGCCNTMKPISIFSYILGATDLDHMFINETSYCLLDTYITPLGLGWEASRYTINRSTAFCGIIFDDIVRDKYIKEVVDLFLDNETKFCTIIADLRRVIKGMLNNPDIIIQCICKYGAQEKVKGFMNVVNDWVNTVLSNMLIDVNFLEEIRPLLTKKGTDKYYVMCKP